MSPLISRMSLFAAAALVAGFWILGAAFAWSPGAALSLPRVAGQAAATLAPALVQLWRIG